MNSFFASLLTAFMSPAGLVLLAALDSSMLFFLPAAVDIAVVILSARHPDFFWAFPFLATAGSLVGAYVTFRIGRKVGEKSLGKWVSERRLKNIQRRIKDKGAIALAIPALLPPPFPLTPFILVCGALKVSASKFFLTLGTVRLLRFGIGSALALVYGRRIIGILESDGFKMIVSIFVAIAIVGTVVSAYKVIRNAKTDTDRRPTSAS